MKIKISEDFSETPGARFINDGPFSAEEFRDKILIKKLNKCIELGIKLEIDLDGGYGYNSGFLEETFGGLIRKGYTKDNLLKTFSFISKEEPYLIDEIKSYIIDESNRVKKLVK